MAVPPALTAAVNLIPGNGKTLVTTWFNSNTVTPAFTTAITLPSGPTKDLVQATLVVYRVLGEQTDDVIAKRRDLIKTWKAEELTAEMNAYTQYHTDSKAAKAGSVVFTPSFRYANSAEKQNAKDTVTNAIAMLTTAMLAAKYVVTQNGHQSDQLEHYTEWFGAYTKPRAEKVANTLKKLHDSIATKPIRIFYRGPKMKGPNDKPDTDDAPGVMTAFASAFRAEQMQNRTEYDRTFNHISLGTAFFARHKKVGDKMETIAKTTMKGYDSVPGVLLHELSHHVCDTKDEIHPTTHKMTYGVGDCRTLATANADLAANNADSLEYFCESFNPEDARVVR